MLALTLATVFAVNNGFGRREGVSDPLVDEATLAALRNIGSAQAGQDNVWRGSVAPGKRWEYSGSSAVIREYRRSVGALLDADSTGARRDAAVHTMVQLGNADMTSREQHTLRKMPLAMLCNSIFVLNAGDSCTQPCHNGGHHCCARLNGLYVEHGQSSGVAQYRKLKLRDTHDKDTTEVFRVGSGRPGEYWWNLAHFEGPDYKKQTIYYGAYALGDAPPELGWASKIFSTNFHGDPSQPPLILPVRQWFPESCDTIAREPGSAHELEKLVRDAMGLKELERRARVGAKQELNAGGTTRYLPFTIGTVPHKAMYQAKGAARHGLPLQVLPGPWPNYVEGKIKNGICATQMLAARPTDVIIFTDGYDAAWDCSGKQLEQLLQGTGKHIALGGEQSWWCPGCSKHLKHAFETEFWPLRDQLRSRGVLKPISQGGTYQYLNSGMLVARAGAIGEFCLEMERRGWTMASGDKRPDDQSAWYEYAVAHPQLVHVDFENLFMTNSHSDKELAQNVKQLPDSKRAVQCEVRRDQSGKLRNSCTERHTCGIHSAGSCNGLPRCPELERRMRAIGLDKWPEANVDLVV